MTRKQIVNKMIVFSVLLCIFIFPHITVSSAPISAGIDDKPYDNSQHSLFTVDDLPGFEIVDKTIVDRYLTLAERITSGLLDQTISFENLSKFQNKNPFQNETILNFLVYPLSETKSDRFDSIANKPQQLQETLNNLVVESDGENEPQVLEKIENVGDKDLGFSMTIGQEVVAYQIDFLWVRRGNLLESTWLIYPVGEDPTINIFQLAKLVDQNVQDRFLGTIFRSSGRFVPELTTYIPTPLDISVEPDVIGTNLIITALLMLPFAAATELFTSLLAEKESTFLERTKLSKIFPKKFDSSNQETEKKRSFLKIIRFFLVLTFYGIVFSLLEQNWKPFTITGLVLFLNMAFAYGLVGIAGEIIQYRKMHDWNKPADLSLRPTNVFLSIFSSVASRLIKLVPGLMFGTPKALVADEYQLDVDKQNKLTEISAKTLLIICFGFWALTVITDLIQNQALSLISSEIVGAIEAFSLVAFAVALENLFVEFLGFPGGFGEFLRKKSRLIWLLALSVITFIFYHSLINPRGDLSAALNESKVWVLHGIVACFIIFVLVVWIINQRKQQKVKQKDHGIKPGAILWSSIVLGFMGLAIIGALFFTRLLNQNNSNSLIIVDRIVSADKDKRLLVPRELILDLSNNQTDEKICYVAKDDIEANLQDRVIWQGVRLVASEYGAQAAYLQPVVVDEFGYKEVVNQLLQEDCTLIVGNGSEPVSAFIDAAEENPNQSFLVLDTQGKSESILNLRLVDYDLSPGFYISGYLSAAVSNTKSVGVFSYRSNSSILSNKDCFVAGVSDFDKVHQANVTVQGWDVEKQSGIFVSSETSPDEGYKVSQEIIKSGVDVLLPLAGIGPEATGYGAARSAQINRGVYVIGAEQDWLRVSPELSDVIITSVIKRFDQSVALAFEAHLNGNYSTSLETGTISSGEIQFSPLRNFLDLLSFDVIEEIINVIDDPSENNCFIGTSIDSDRILPISTVKPTITLTPTTTPTPTSTSTPKPTPMIDKGIYNPENGHWYRVIYDGRSFHAANYYCKQLSAHLVTISNEAENEFVFNLNPFTWLGATDEENEGQWAWITGEPWTYTNWADGEPNNKDGIEHYMHYKEPSAPDWNDIPGGSMSFICEWEE